MKKSFNEINETFFGISVDEHEKNIIYGNRNNFKFYIKWK